MKFSFIHEKTTVLQVDGQLVQVSGLPEELKNEVATADRMIEDKLDAVYRLETVELALHIKLQQIQATISELLKKNKEAKQQEAEVKQELDKEAAESTKATKVVKLDEKPKKARK